MSGIVRSLLLLEAMIFIFAFSPVKSQVAGKDTYLSIDQVTDQSINRFGIQFCYKT